MARLRAISPSSITKQHWISETLPVFPPRPSNLCRY